MSEISISQIIEALSEPFPSSDVEWKPQQVSKDGTKALAAAYVDARRYQERLDLVCPDWSSRIELMADGRVAKVSLTIAGVTREDVGEADNNDPNTVTTAVAQAFKRACAAFGLGRYLYFLPMTWCAYDQQRKKLLETPQLPDWALPGWERQSKANATAVEREKVLSSIPEADPDPAPAPAKPAPTPEVATISNPAGYVMPGGKYQGKTLAEIFASKEGEDYLRWFANLDGKGYQARNGAVEAQRMVRAFLAVNAAYAG